MDRLLRPSQACAAGDDHAARGVADPRHWVVDIEEATPADGFCLCLRFSDGVARVVDFEPFLSASLNPMIQRFLDPERFRQFTVQNGNLMWGDYDLCFPVADLYDGLP